MGNQIQHKVHFIVRGHKMGDIRHGDAKIGHLDIGRRRPDERIIGRKVGGYIEGYRLISGMQVERPNNLKSQRFAGDISPGGQADQLFGRQLGQRIGI